MKKATLFLGLLFIIISATAQVGIGTVTPDASSILDLSATDKGILIPQVSLSDVTDTMLDGVNIAATGLLIYNTNAGVTDGKGVGYYYFNGATWERLSTSVEDIDWYKEGTTTAPSTINDSIYTQGNVTIGNTTTPYKLGINETNTSASRTLNILSENATTTKSSSIHNEVNYTGTDTISAAYNLVNGTGNGLIMGNYNKIENSGSGRHYGMYNYLSGEGTGYQYGIFNDLVILSTSGLQQKGIYNRIEGDATATVHGVDTRIVLTGNGGSIGIRNNLYSSGSGTKIGMITQFDGGSGDKYGVYNNLRSNNNNDSYGVYNTLYGTGTGDRYGTHTTINSASGGTHYGVYSDVQKSGSYSGYFIGDFLVDTDTFFVDSVNDRVGIGTTTPGVKLEVNGTLKASQVNFSGLPTYPDDTAAGVGGLVAGYLYKTAGGELRIKL